MNINLQKGVNIKSVKLGFSWTIFFFGFWTLMFRGMWKQVALSFFFFPLCCYLFKGNEMYIKKLIKEGYQPADEAAKGYVEALKTEI